MKLFLKNITFFLMLPFLGWVLLFSLDYDREFAWNFVEGDCGGRGNWVYNRIYNNPKLIDVAFIGSSCIIAGIDDQIVEDSFQNLTQLDWNFANIGYCRFGRNMSYVVLKELLKKKKAKYVVLEVRHDEDLSSHPMFPYLANREDVLMPMLYNQVVFSDIYLASVSRMEFWKQKILYEKKDYKNDENPFGHAKLKTVEDPSVLEKAQQKKERRQQRRDFPFARKVNMMYPRFYLKKINKLCKENDVELLFLYTPFFGAIDYPPKELETYQNYGEVLFPPPDIFKDKNNWADEVHINENGGKQNSYWFANEFATYLQNKKK